MKEGKRRERDMDGCWVGEKFRTIKNLFKNQQENEFIQYPHEPGFNKLVHGRVILKPCFSETLLF